MSESFLQRQLTHTALPHRCRMGMPQRMRSLLRCADSQPVQAAGEFPSDSLIAQRLTLPRTRPAHKEHEGAGRLDRPLVQYITVHRIQRAWLVQIDDSLVTSLGARATRMVITLADRHPPAPVRHVVQLKTE